MMVCFFFLLALKWDGISIKRGTLADALAFALVRCEGNGNYKGYGCGSATDSLKRGNNGAG